MPNLLFVVDPAQSVVCKPLLFRVFGTIQQHPVEPGRILQVIPGVGTFGHQIDRFALEFIVQIEKLIFERFDGKCIFFLPIVGLPEGCANSARHFVVGKTLT